MMRVLFVLVALTLSACVTVQPDGWTGQGKADPDEAARVNSALGNRYMRDGQLELAREKLETAVKFDPGLADARANLAFVYQRLGLAEQSRREYRKAVSLAPNNPNYRNAYGVFLCAQGDGEAAQQQFDAALEVPGYRLREVTLTNSGICHRKLNDLAAAEQAFRGALRSNNNYPDALAQLALLAYDRGDYLTARAFVQRYDAAAPLSPGVLWVAVRTERALGDRDAAADYAAQLKQNFPRSDETYQLLRLENNG
ncbi:type IV pilus biogenesis/stability protein PilW [bacterium]|nr:type IV pilus biogenesis/stability protein PilW [bacterium]